MMNNNSYRITQEQSDFLSSKGNASAYLRELIEGEMKKERFKDSDIKPEESLLDVLNFKTAIIMVMLNEILKAFPELDEKPWENKDLSFESNWTKTFGESSNFYRSLFEK